LGKSQGKDPLTLPFPAWWRGNKEDEKNLTAPLTLVLSRKGREEFKGCPPHPTLSQGGERREKKDEKNLTESPHPCPLPLVEMEEKGREGNKKEFT